MIRQYLILILLAALPAMSQAGDCHKTGTTCIDTTPSKTIATVDVPIAAVGGCWEYQDAYECVANNTVDYCQPVIDFGCGVTNSVCNETNFNGSCKNYLNTYLCLDKELPTPLPQNVTLIDTTRHITDEKIDDSGCAATKTNPGCTNVAEVCVDPGPTKNIKGLDVTRDCWAWNRTYKCLSSALTTADCDKWRNDPTCTETSSRCAEMLPPPVNVCQVVEHTFNCTTGGGPTVTASCDTQKFCIEGKCFDTGYGPDKDFGKAVSGMELVREAAYYMDPATLTFFNGNSNSCEKKLWGLGNCCNTDGSGAGMSNNSFANSLGNTAMHVAYEEVKTVGSTYIYDMLWDSGSAYLQDLAVAVFGEAGGVAASGSFSVYGFEFAVAADGSITYTAFCWPCFVVAVIIYVVMELIQCSDEEQKLAMKRGAGLCAYVGDYCSQKVLGSCVTRTQSYCCYNSRLAKIIATAGRAQLGLGFGSAQGPDCKGFTANELQAIDFSKIDMSEFIATIVPSAKSNEPAMKRAQDKIQSYFPPTTPP